ncbi:AAA family ATPase [Xinfangfangia sp. D13-10-4-6]|uniref:AAA family ATPase n=1 Tax=Pseudogemmobacter hezensis TaxID=2737662 RepID=UPI0015560900|nr:AAA family ATPase [Pseudogemmobacter hezensis]NPD15284.1 AAA family ATPase [Pseudogemmobacter hezensis]
MTSVATIQPDPAPIAACTISRDVQNFEMLIDEMEREMGEAWGDLGFEDALVFLQQPEASELEFIAVALDAEDEDDLTLIASVIRAARTANTHVILVANQLSPAGLHQLMRLGADDFVPYPLPEGALHDAISKIRAAAQASAQAAQARAAAPMPQTGSSLVLVDDGNSTALRATGNRNGLVLPIHGMAGGSGASTFAANLAWELANSDKLSPPRVCLLDLDFQYGSIATYLDLPRKDTIFEVLTDPTNVDSDALIRSMQTYNDRLSVFTAPAEMLPLDIISGEDLGRLIDMAAANFDFVLIDMPKTVVTWTEAVLSRAHVYFALMDLDLRSAQNVLRFVRALKAEALPHEKLRYVLNKAPKFTDLSAKSRVKRMAESLEIQIEVQLPDGGGQVTQSNDHGLPLAESAAKNPLRKELQKLAKSLFELSKVSASARS